MKTLLRNLTLPGISVLLAALVFLGPAGLEASPYSQGRVAFARGDFDSAMRLLEESTRTDPSNGNAYFYIGLIHERKGRKPESIAAYKQGVARRMDSELREKALWKIVLYSKYIGDWGSVSIYSSQFLKYKHHPEMARLQSMAANQGGSSSAELVRLVQKGQKAEKGGNLTEAIGYYEEALDIDGDAHSVRWNLASVAMKANQYTRAVKHLKYLDRKDPQWKYTYKLGVCYYQLGQYQSALASFDRATEQNRRPSSSFKYFMLLGRGLTYLELEDVQKSEKNLIEAARIKSSALLDGALARLALMKGDRAEAEKRMNRSLKEDSAQLDALSVRALLSSDPSAYEAFQDTLYKNTVYQPSYYNAVTLQYVHVLVARSKFDRARTVLDTLDRKERESIHGMKYDIAGLSNRPLILPGTIAELKTSSPDIPRSRILEEEIQMFLLFGESAAARSAIQKWKEARIPVGREEDPDRPPSANGQPTNGGSETEEPERPEPDSTAGWLREYPEHFEYIARLELLNSMLAREEMNRARKMAEFWNRRSPDFKKGAMELPRVQSLVESNQEWTRLYAPETLKPDGPSGPQDSSQDNPQKIEEDKPAPRGSTENQQPQDSSDNSGTSDSSGAPSHPESSGDAEER
ncbi:MAG: tetratricopeptide repeat protein [Leptospiraceae bacterium]|nr:tetratricopeptide repeat protein [Leptospiraceae bacterium]